MNNFFHLSENDFTIAQNNRGSIVALKPDGIWFVMFTADPGQCKYCDLAKPEFSILPQFIQNVKFGMVNLQRCPTLRQNSMSTITPLQNVPAFILYMNGIPKINYDSERTTRQFAEFLKKATTTLQQQQNQFGAQPTAQHPHAPPPQNGSLAEVDTTPGGAKAYDFDYVAVTDPGLMGSVTCTEDGVCYFTHGDIGVNSNKNGGQPHRSQAYEPKYVPPTGYPQAPMQQAPVVQPYAPPQPQYPAMQQQQPQYAAPPQQYGQQMRQQMPPQNSPYVAQQYKQYH